jgi:hypothetical protein
MSTPFQRPVWVDALEDPFRRALPPEFQPLEETAERHGAWQWTARAAEGDDAGPWLIAEVTPLSGTTGDAQPRRLALAAWRLTGGAAAIDETSVVRRDVESSGESFKALADSFAAVVHTAATRSSADVSTAFATVTTHDAVRDPLPIRGVVYSSLVMSRVLAPALAAILLLVGSWIADGPAAVVLSGLGLFLLGVIAAWGYYSTGRLTHEVPPGPAKRRGTRRK